MFFSSSKEIVIGTPHWSSETGRRARPQANLTNSSRSSAVKDSRACHRNLMAGWSAFAEMYLTCRFRAFRFISGEPHTRVSSSAADNRYRGSAGMIRRRPSRIQSTCTSNSRSRALSASRAYSFRCACVTTRPTPPSLSSITLPSLAKVVNVSCSESSLAPYIDSS